MPVARLQASFNKSAIEPDAGIIRGVRVMEKGKLATFADEKGKPKSVTITDEHISALMNHAGNRAIPSHWTHDWADSEKDPLHMRVGMLNGFRKDEEGNLIGDLHLAPGEYREKAMWSAEHEPGNIMLSAVFNYAKADAKCIPKDFQACDLVSKGAAVTALLEEATKSPSMIEDLITALQDPTSGPHLAAAIKAAIKSVDSASEDSAAAAMESDAGVSDADKKSEDDTKPALMRAFSRCHRAFLRQLGELKAAAPDKTALLAEMKTLASAEATALLGKGGILGGGGNGDADVYTATLAEYRKSAPSDQIAVSRMLRDKPELYPLHEERTVKRIATFKPV